VAQELMEELLVLHGATVGIHDGPKQNEDEEETGNRNHTSHIHHLVEFVGNENTEGGEEEHGENPSPHEHGINIQTGAFTATASVKHAKENQDEDHDEQNSHEPHFSFN